MKHKILLLYCLMLLVTGTVHAQKYLFTVTVDIQADKKELGDTIESYILRELRSLGDVEIRPENGNYHIRMIVMEDRTVSGQDLGVTLAMVVTFRHTCITGVPVKGVTPTGWPCEVYEQFLVHTGNRKNIRTLCENMITAFDTDSLKPVRTLLFGNKSRPARKNR